MHPSDDIQAFLRKTGKGSNDYRLFDDPNDDAVQERWAILASLPGSVPSRHDTPPEKTASHDANTDWVEEGASGWPLEDRQSGTMSVASDVFDREPAAAPLDSAVDCTESSGSFGHLFRQASGSGASDAISGKETPLKPLLKRIAQ